MKRIPWRIIAKSVERLGDLPGMAAEKIGGWD